MSLLVDTPAERTATEQSGEPALRIADIRARTATAARRTLPTLEALEGDGELVAFDRSRRGRASHGVAPQTTRVLIADGAALLRAALRVLLEAGGRISVVGEATSGEEAIAVARRIRPDVVLIDERLPGLDCLEVTSRIVSELGLAVLLLTASEGDERIFAALRAGANGLLVKDTEPAELVRAVDALAHGGAQLSPTLTRLLIAELGSRPAHARPNSELLDELSPRELEVMELVGHGLSNGEIAERLVVSPATAKTHVSRAMVKLRVRDRAQLVVLAYEAGLVVPRAQTSVPLGQPASLAT
jgi:DNA-binding NarL/FixJ family response regulator